MGRLVTNVGDDVDRVGEDVGLDDDGSAWVVDLLVSGAGDDSDESVGKEGVEPPVIS